VSEAAPVTSAGRYEQRSLLAHGIAFGVLDAALDAARKNLYRTQERLVQGIIRKALLDSTFRDIFASDASGQHACR
jgi:hypothetical protein